MKLVALITARMGSVRFPGKVIAPLAGKPLVAWIIDAAKAVKGVDEVIVCTGDTSENDELERVALQYEALVYRGPEKDLYPRHRGCWRHFNYRYYIDLSGDCPFQDSTALQMVVSEALLGRGDSHHSIGFEPLACSLGQNFGTVIYAQKFLDYIGAFLHELSPVDYMKIREQYWLVKGNASTTHAIRFPSYIPPTATPVKTSIDYPMELAFWDFMIRKHGRGPANYAEIVSWMGEHVTLYDAKGAQL